jgi:hypothetical protein
LFWRRAGRIASIEHIVDVGLFEKQLKRLVGSVIRNPEFLTAFQNQEVIIVITHCVWVNLDEPIQKLVNV